MGIHLKAIRDDHTEIYHHEFSFKLPAMNLDSQPFQASRPEAEQSSSCWTYVRQIFLTQQAYVWRKLSHSHITKDFSCVYIIVWELMLSEKKNLVFSETITEK
jgi:hypothetical protein